MRRFLWLSFILMTALSLQHHQLHLQSEQQQQQPERQLRIVRHQSHKYQPHHQQNGKVQLLFRAHHKSGTYLSHSIHDPIANANTLYSSGVEELPGKHHIVHFIRHPVDMLMSGYLYHQACNEHWTHYPTLEKSIDNNAQFPLNFPLRVNFCSWLQKAPMEDALIMELYRGLGAKNDIYRMFRDILTYQSNPLPVMNFCMSMQRESMPHLREFVEPFLVARKPVRQNLKDTRHHHTNHSKQQHMYELAESVIYRMMPASILDDFPCPSDFMSKEQRAAYNQSVVEERAKNYLRNDTVAWHYLRTIQPRIFLMPWSDAVREDGVRDPLRGLNVNFSVEQLPSLETEKMLRIPLISHNDYVGNKSIIQTFELQSNSKRF